jgi:hypothetical protein
VARRVTAVDMRHCRVPSNVRRLTASDVPSKCSAYHAKERNQSCADSNVEFAVGSARYLGAVIVLHTVLQKVATEGRRTMHHHVLIALFVCHPNSGLSLLLDVSSAN